MLDHENQPNNIYRGVFAVNLFPATNPDDYISLRIWDRDGNEQEIGILRRINDWPMEAQIMVRAALERRYWLQTVTGVDNIKMEMGHLTLKVRTNHGPRQFTMRWTQSQVQDFGESGKVHLLDLDDNPLRWFPHVGKAAAAEGAGFVFAVRILVIRVVGPITRRLVRLLILPALSICNQLLPNSPPRVLNGWYQPKRGPVNPARNHSHRRGVRRRTGFQLPARAPVRVKSNTNSAAQLWLNAMLS